MARIDPHPIEIPTANLLGPDPEPLGTRFELVLERAKTTARPSLMTRRAPVPNQRVHDCRHSLRRRAHVIPR